MCQVGVSSGRIKWVCQVGVSSGCQVGVSSGCVKWVCQVGVSIVFGSAAHLDLPGVWREPGIDNGTVPFPNSSPRGFTGLLECFVFPIVKSRADCCVSCGGEPAPTVNEETSIDCNEGVIQLYPTLSPGAISIGDG